MSDMFLARHGHVLTFKSDTELDGTGDDDGGGGGSIRDPVSAPSTARGGPNRCDEYEGGQSETSTGDGEPSADAAGAPPFLDVMTRSVNSRAKREDGELKSGRYDMQGGTSIFDEAGQHVQGDSR
ncbi:MAG: hypothetical protein M1837_003742 [Sclerophora amabilis]|nr:MAG: hypothetical protein M1837_003742 [Sclerophora amabilis]